MPSITKKKIVESSIRLAIVIAVVALAFWLGNLVTANDEFQKKVLDYGYFGVLILAIVSGFNVVVPIPAIAFLPVLVNAGLDFWMIIVLISVGMTIGDSIGYFIGYTGRHLPQIEESKFFKKLDEFKNKYYWLPLLMLGIYATIVPLPNELIVIPMAVLGYKYWQVATLMLMGNFAFNTLAAYGLTSLFDFVN